MDTQTHHRGPAAAVDASHVPKPTREIIGACCGCLRLHVKDSNEWSDEYLVEPGPNQVVSHGICPACVRKFYPDVADKVLEGK